jgi:hypothetical protein
MKSPYLPFVSGNSALAALVAVGCALAWQSVAAAAPDIAEGVGTVTLTVGKALIVDAAGVAVSVHKGSVIHAGDRVETADGGHVHIRFVDGALVSVRPTSRLVVEDYQYDARQVEKSLVRFRLDQGVARAISGAAAEGARERFRLNTPLVAIGVRGTDFVVRTEAGQTLALVNQGAIVMAPFGEGCQRQTTGPCGSDAAKLLTAGMGNVLMEFRDHFARPEIKPLNNLVGGDGVAVAYNTRTAQATTASAEPLVSRDARKTGQGDDVVAAALLQGAVHQASEAANKPVPSAPAPVAPPSVPDQPIQPIQPTQPAAPAQLAWGRWGDSTQAGDISLPRLQARDGREVTLGNNQYALFRNPSTASILSSGLGSLGFSLQQSQAQFVAANGSTQAASVSGGSLTLDFAARQFSTQLNLTSAATGAVGLQAGGLLHDDGRFIDRSIANQAVAGVVALDAKTAGYLFEKAASGGVLSGITLWGR